VGKVLEGPLAGLCVELYAVTVRNTDVRLCCYSRTPHSGGFVRVPRAGFLEDVEDAQFELTDYPIEWSEDFPLTTADPPAADRISALVSIEFQERQAERRAGRWWQIFADPVRARHRSDSPHVDHPSDQQEQQLDDVAVIEQALARRPASDRRPESRPTHQAIIHGQDEFIGEITDGPWANHRLVIGVGRPPRYFKKPTCRNSARYNFEVQYEPHDPTSTEDDWEDQFSIFLTLQSLLEELTDYSITWQPLGKRPG
jgi:hypothetical protein